MYERFSVFLECLKTYLLAPTLQHTKRPIRQNVSGLHKCCQKVYNTLSNTRRVHRFCSPWYDVRCLVKGIYDIFVY